MHPILARKSTLILYLAAWMPIVLLIAALLVFSGGLSWVEAAALAIPMALVYAFLCLSSWYLCRSMPVQETNFFRLISGHALAAFFSSSMTAFR